MPRALHVLAARRKTREKSLKEPAVGSQTLVKALM